MTAHDPKRAQTFLPPPSAAEELPEGWRPMSDGISAYAHSSGAEVSFVGYVWAYWKGPSPRGRRDGQRHTRSEAMAAAVQGDAETFQRVPVGACKLPGAGDPYARITELETALAAAEKRVEELERELAAAKEWTCRACRDDADEATVLRAQLADKRVERWHQTRDAALPEMIRHYCFNGQENSEAIAAHRASIVADSAHGPLTAAGERAGDG